MRRPVQPLWYYTETLGFDLSTREGRTQTHIRCSQCQAATINGVPCHETGCPNRRGKCRECDFPIRAYLRICESCEENS